MVLSRLRFVINEKSFYFDIVNFPFLDGDVPGTTSLVFICLNLFDLLECLVMFMTLILVIRF